MVGVSVALSRVEIESSVNGFCCRLPTLIVLRREFSSEVTFFCRGCLFRWGEAVAASNCIYLCQLHLPAWYIVYIYRVNGPCKETLPFQRHASQTKKACSPCPASLFEPNISIHPFIHSSHNNIPNRKKRRKKTAGSHKPPHSKYRDRDRVGNQR